MNIGIDANNNFIEISEEARKTNLAVFGIKNTGKAFTLIPSLFAQDLSIKNKGVTIVVDTPELAWYLYGICRIKKRKVELLKPSVNFDITDKLLFSKDWNYEEVNKIYDFKKAIEDKKVTIIDMEEERYGEKSVRAASMLLLQLQSAMVMTTKKIDHSVYIDGGANYLPYLKNLLKYGDYYGFSTTLFFKSRDELKDNIILIDNYVRNFILLQGISYEDAKYFGMRFNLSKYENEAAQKLMNRGFGSISYEILENDTFKRVISEGSLMEFSEEKKAEYKEEAAKWKRKNKDKIVEIGDHHYQLEKEGAALSIESGAATITEDIEQDIIDSVKDVELPAEEVSIQDDEILEAEPSILEIDSPIKESIEIDNPKTVPVEKPVKKVNQGKIELQTPVREKGKEPQLNQRIKPRQTEKKEEKKSYSLLDEFEPAIKEPVIDDGEITEIDYLDSDLAGFDMSDIDLDDMPSLEDLSESAELEELPTDEDKPIKFDLSNDDVVFSFGKKKHPYYNLKNKQADKALSIFKK